MPSFFMPKCKWHPVVAPICWISIWIFIWIVRNTINIFWTNICYLSTLLYNVSNTNYIIWRNMTVRNRNIAIFYSNCASTCTFKTNKSNFSRNYRINCCSARGAAISIPEWVDDAPSVGDVLFPNGDVIVWKPGTGQKKLLFEKK